LFGTRQIGAVECGAGDLPFIAAGRDKARIQAVVDKIPGIESADYEVVEVDHTVEALTELFKGAEVVSNMVGPFIKYGPEVVEACLAAGCHYTDTTGEQDWVLKCEQDWGRQVRRKGPVAGAQRGADVHHRRDRGEHLSGNTLQAYAAFSLLQQKPDRVGFASACQTFGHRQLLGQLQAFGLIMKPNLTIQD
jgi:hypothetical protein